MPGKNKGENIRLTSRDIAGYCQVSKSTVLEWIKSGRLKAFRLPGGHYRIDRKDFREFLERWNMPVRGWPFETEETRKGGALKKGKI
ncbi:MAG TPA: helix-turn-helix domain-containing protein [Dehalococcoidales bacterium]|nr:helix-turn-helix domain-containing protein [Dehalococcoidales bacterium]HJX13759.1 helix-turn-helix domain-containing protein [Dehalococcoidales bacterium]